jgi:uncharacterized membrane protein YhaH (DUF805 family)
MSEYLDGLQLYAVFHGRTSYGAYWRFIIASAIMAFAFSLVDMLAGWTTPLGIATPQWILFHLLFGQAWLSDSGWIGVLLLANSTPGLFATLYAWLVLVPVCAITVRRLHDTGRSGRWAFMLCIPLLGDLLLLPFMLSKGELGENRYSTEVLKINDTIAPGHRIQ